MEYIVAYDIKEGIEIVDRAEMPIKDCVFVLTNEGTHSLDHREIHRCIAPVNVWYGYNWQKGKYYHEIDDLLHGRLKNYFFEKMGEE